MSSYIPPNYINNNQFIPTFNSLNFSEPNDVSKNNLNLSTLDSRYLKKISNDTTNYDLTVNTMTVDNNLVMAQGFANNFNIANDLNVLNNLNSNKLKAIDNSGLVISNQTDSTKILTLNNSNITTGKTRVLSVPNENGIIITDNSMALKTKPTYKDYNYSGLFSNLLIYIDMFDSNRLGKDVSGRPRVSNALPIGVKPATIGGRNCGYWSQAEGITGETTQRMTLTNYVSLIKSQTALSFSFWMYPTSNTGNKILFTITDNLNASRCLDCILFNSSTRLGFRLRNGSTVYWQLTASNTYSANTWSHIVVSCGALGPKLYVNGVLDFTATMTGIDFFAMPSSVESINDFLLGTDKDIVGGDVWRYGYSGYQTDFAVWSTQLTQSEVNVLYSDNFGYDVIPLIGQSNMAGRATADTIDTNYSLLYNRVNQFPFDANITYNSTTNVFTVNSTNVIPATNPLDHISNVPGGFAGEQAGQTGLWKTFAETILPYIPPKRKILLVPCGKSGTGFSTGEWIKGAPLYNASILSINTALGLNSGNKLYCILFHQGENDSGNPTSYDFYFRNFLANLKTDIPSFNDDIPFVMGEIHVKTQASPTTSLNMNAVLKYVSSEYNNTSIVECGTFSTFDDTHFDSASFRTIGIEYAKKVIDFYKNTKIHKLSLPSLNVEGSTSLNTLNVSSSLSVLGSGFFNNTFTVLGNSIIGAGASTSTIRNLTVNNSATCMSSLNVSGTGFINTSLVVGDALRFNAQSTCNGNLYVQTNLDVGKAINCYNINVGYPSEFFDKLKIAGETTISSTLNTTGIITAPSLKFFNSGTLNHYEEGTFTCSFINPLATGTGTYSDNNCSYTRIGRAIYFIVRFKYNNNSNAWSINPIEIQLGSLPKPTSTRNSYSVGYNTGYLMSDKYQLLFVQSNNENVKLHKLNQVYPQSVLYSDYSGNGTFEIQFSGFYFI